MASSDTMRRWTTIAAFCVTIGMVAGVAICATADPQTPAAPAGGAAPNPLAPAEPSRKTLKNVHRIVINMQGQNYQLNGCLQYQMECLGESKDYDYWFFAGVGGDAHVQVFTSDTSRWCHSLSQIDFSPAYIKKLYDACGYDFTYVTEEEFNADKPRYLQQIIQSIDRGIPVISKGTSGPSEFAAVVGYEDGGRNLLLIENEDKTWKLPTTDRVRSLFVFVGAKKQAPPLAEVYRNAVLNIPAMLTRPQEGGVYFGKDAFEAWSARLLTEDYETWTDEQLDIWRLHTSYVCIVATNGSCRAFLQRAAKLCPDLPFIPQVEQVYEKMGRLWKQQMDATGGSFNMTKKTLRSKELKQPIADFIHQYSDCCDEILDIFEANGYGQQRGE